MIRVFSAVSLLAIRPSFQKFLWPPSVTIRRFSSENESKNQDARVQPSEKKDAVENDLSPEKKSVSGSFTSHLEHETKHMEYTGPGQKDLSCSSVHFSSRSGVDSRADHFCFSDVLAHPVHPIDEVNNVEITHFEPRSIRDRLAWLLIRMIRFSFDVMSGFAG